MSYLRTRLSTSLFLSLLISLFLPLPSYLSLSLSLSLSFYFYSSFYLSQLTVQVLFFSINSSKFVNFPSLLFLPVWEWLRVVWNGLLRLLWLTWVAWVHLTWAREEREKKGKELWGIKVIENKYHILPNLYWCCFWCFWCCSCCCFEARENKNDNITSKRSNKRWMMYIRSI